MIWFRKIFPHFSALRRLHQKRKTRFSNAE
jgi:hypothetical protein